MANLTLDEIWAARGAKPPANVKITPLDVFKKLQGAGGSAAKSAATSFLKEGVSKSLSNVAKAAPSAVTTGIKIAQNTLVQGGQAADTATMSKLQEQGFDDAKLASMNINTPEQKETFLREQEAGKKWLASTKPQAGTEWDTGKALQTAGEMAIEGTVKPVAKFAAAIPPTLAGQVQGMAESAWELPGAGMAWAKGERVPGLKEKISDIKKRATAPVMVPGLGNVNLNRGNKEGEYDMLKSFVTQSAAGADALYGLMNIYNPILSSKKAAFSRGAKQAFAHEAASDNANIISSEGVDLGGLTTAGASSLIAGTMGAGFQGAFNQVFKRLKVDTDPIEKIAAKSGLSTEVVQTVKKMTPDETKEQAALLDMAFHKKMNIDDPDILSPMESLGDQWTKGMKSLHGILKEKGKAIGKIKKDVRQGPREAVNLREIKDQFQQELDDASIKFHPINEGDGKSLDFSESAWKRSSPNSEDHKLLEDAWDEVKNAKTMNDLILARDVLAENLDYGRANQKIGAGAERIVKNLHKSITEKVHALNPELGEVDAVFSELIKATEAFSQKAGGKMKFTVEEAMDGTNAPTILRRALGQGIRENSKLLRKMSELGEKYDIPELLNLTKRARMAQIAEDTAQLDLDMKPASIGGRMFQAGKALQETAGGAVGMNPGKAVQGVANFAQSLKNPKSQKDALLDLLENTPKFDKAISQKVLKHPITKQFVKFLKKTSQWPKAGVPQKLTSDFIGGLKTALMGSGASTPASQSDADLTAEFDKIMNSDNTEETPSYTGSSDADLTAEFDRIMAE